MVEIRGTLGIGGSTMSVKRVEGMLKETRGGGSTLDTSSVVLAPSVMAGTSAIEGNSKPLNDCGAI